MSVRLVSENHEAASKQAQTERATDQLRILLRDLFRMRHEGVAYAKLAHAQGLVDGYMKTMIDLHLASDAQLLQIVAEERRGTDGPALKTIAQASVGTTITTDASAMGEATVENSMLETRCAIA